MKTIRDSLSLFLSLFSSLVLFGLYDLLYGFRAIRQIKFCLFGTIIYFALHFFLGDPTYTFLPTSSIVCIIMKQRRNIKGKKFQQHNGIQRLYLETLSALKEEKKRIHS